MAKCSKCSRPLLRTVTWQCLRCGGPGESEVVERLRAIVEKLPKTADGVPVVPGMVIWPPEFIEDEQGATVKIIARDNLTGDMLEHGTSLLWIGKCYSTREAAEAARRVVEGAK